MKTKTINLYEFDELSDQAKQRAIANNCCINVDYREWYHSVYDDAENIGLKITGFDLDRNRHCTGQAIDDVLTMAHKIKTDHGFDTPTYKLANEFIKDYAALDEDIDAGELRDFENKFLKSILEEYSVLLQREYEWLTSEEPIVDTLRANEYEFLEDGSRA
jgi:hypothetical protein